MEKKQLSPQSKHKEIKKKIESRLKLKHDIILNF